MNISHEVPLDLLETSLTFNDYDYLLPHYYIKYPKYKEFYKKCRELGRFIIMDNGLFEGGVLPENQLLEIINDINPNIFIVPDVWNNYISTIKKAEEWINKSSLPQETKLMIVLQGKEYYQLQECVNEGLEMGYKHFGLNHSSIAYTSLYYHRDPSISKMMGRIITLNKLIEEDISDKFKKSYIHLLGLNLPQELLYINHKEYISSIDTSNPIINGIKGIRYSSLGLKDKPLEKIEEFMEKDLASNIEDIIFNINQFSKWANV